MVKILVRRFRVHILYLILSRVIIGTSGTCEGKTKWVTFTYSSKEVRRVTTFSRHTNKNSQIGAKHQNISEFQETDKDDTTKCERVTNQDARKFIAGI
jgi:hypothetical protein